MYVLSSQHDFTLKFINVYNHIIMHVSERSYIKQYHSRYHLKQLGVTVYTVI